MNESDEYGESRALVPQQDARQVAQYDRIQIETEVATAKQYPRDVKKCVQTMIALATSSLEVAESMRYELPPRKKTDKATGKITYGDPITGPSIRAMELIGPRWKNVRFGTRIISVDRADRRVVVEGGAWDMEDNVPVTEQVSRRITMGGDDGVNMAIGQATSIAIRNVLKRIIGPFVNEVLDATDRYIAQNTKLDDAKDKMFKYFAGVGIDHDALLAFLDLKSDDQIATAHVARLRGLGNAIKEGFVTVESVLKKDQVTTERGSVDLGDIGVGEPVHGTKPEKNQPTTDPEQQADPLTEAILRPAKNFVAELAQKEKTEKETAERELEQQHADIMTEAELEPPAGDSLFPDAPPPAPREPEPPKGPGRPKKQQQPPPMEALTVAMTALDDLGVETNSRMNILDQLCAKSFGLKWAKLTEEQQARIANQAQEKGRLWTDATDQDALESRIIKVTSGADGNIILAPLTAWQRAVIELAKEESA